MCFVEIEKELEKTDTKKIPILQSSKKRSVTDGDPMADGGQMSAGMSCYLSKCIYLFFWHQLKGHKLYCKCSWKEKLKTIGQNMLYYQFKFQVFSLKFFKVTKMLLALFL